MNYNDHDYLSRSQYYRGYFKEILPGFLNTKKKIQAPFAENFIMSINQHRQYITNPIRGANFDEMQQEFL